MKTAMTITVTHPRVAAIRKRAPQLPELTLATWTEDPRLYLQKGQPWIVLPAERDPLRTLKGEVAIPDRCISELQDLVKAGVDFDRLAVAHEIAPSLLPGSVVEVLHKSPAGVPCDMPAVKKLLGDAPPPPRSTQRMANILDKVVETLTSSDSIVGAVVSAPLDPIVFGVIGPAGPPAEGEGCAWFPLTAWHW